MSGWPNFRLDGQRALVTGASSGLGLHFAQTLAQAGAEVVLAARRLERLEGAVQALRGAGHRASAVALDVCDAASVQTVVADLSARALLPDVLVHCAGVAVSRPLLEQTEADWDQVLDTNLKGAWLVGQTWARARVSAGLGGAIVNIASITATGIVVEVSATFHSASGWLFRKATHTLLLDILHMAQAQGLTLGRGTHRLTG